MRAEKRKKNAPKELERLKKILGSNADVVMEEVKEVATVVAPKKVLEAAGESSCGGAALESRGGEGRAPLAHTGPAPEGLRCPGRLSSGPGLPKTCLLSARLPLPSPPRPRPRLLVSRFQRVSHYTGSSVAITHVQGRPAVYLLLFL